jgi:hypothetical protein
VRPFSTFSVTLSFVTAFVTDCATRSGELWRHSH